MSTACVSRHWLALLIVIGTAYRISSFLGHISRYSPSGSIHQPLSSNSAWQTRQNSLSNEVQRSIFSRSSIFRHYGRKKKSESMDADSDATGTGKSDSFDMFEEGLSKPKKEKKPRKKADPISSAEGEVSADSKPIKPSSKSKRNEVLMNEGDYRDRKDSPVVDDASVSAYKSTVLSARSSTRDHNDKLLNQMQVFIKIVLDGIRIVDLNYHFENGEFRVDEANQEQSATWDSGSFEERHSLFERDATKITLYRYRVRVDDPQERTHYPAADDTVCMDVYVLPVLLKSWPVFFADHKQSKAMAPHVYCHRSSSIDRARCRDTIEWLTTRDKDGIYIPESIAWLGSPDIGKSVDISYSLMKFIENLSRPGEDSSWPTHIHLRCGFHVFTISFNGKDMTEIDVRRVICGDSLSVNLYFVDMEFADNERHVLLFDPMEISDCDPNIPGEINSLFVFSNRELHNTLQTANKAGLLKYVVPVPSLMEMRIMAHAMYHLSDDFCLEDELFAREHTADKLKMTMDIVERRVAAIGCVPRYVFRNQGGYNAYANYEAFPEINEW